MRTLIGGIGETGSADDDGGSDTIAGTLAQRLRRDAPVSAARVSVEYLGGDPYSVAERLSDEWPRFERVIFVSGVERRRAPGTVSVYRWNGEAWLDEREDDEAEPAILDRTLRVLRDMDQLPDETIIVEVEPDGDGGGSGLAGRDVRAALERTHALLRRLATDRRAVSELPDAALGGARPLRAD